MLCVHFLGSVVLWVHQLIEVELDSKNAMAHSNLGVVLEDHEVPNVPMFHTGRVSSIQRKWLERSPGFEKKKDPSILLVKL